MYTPAESPRIAVSGDSTLAAIHESSRVTLLALPGVAAFAEIGADPDAAASDVGWVGTPPRLLVVARYATHGTVHLLDPQGPRSIAEIRLEVPMRLFATVGGAALVIGTLGAAVLSAGESHLTVYPFPARAMPLTAGAAAGQFVAALPGSIEEWDPVSRMPKRRLRLPRSAAITAVGGSERMVWMTTQQEPARIDVIPLVNRGQPRAHDLPEPIARIASHPRSDVVACVGAETGRLYVIDLDGRTRAKVIGDVLGPGVDRVDAIGLAIGRGGGVLVGTAGHPVAFVALDGRGEKPGAAGAAATAGREAPGALEGGGVQGQEVAAEAAEATDATAAGDAEPAVSAEVSGEAPAEAVEHPGEVPAGSSDAGNGVEVAAAALSSSAPSPPPPPRPPPPPLPASPPPPPAPASAPAPTLRRSFAAAPGPAAALAHLAGPAPGRRSWRDDVVAWRQAITAAPLDHAVAEAPAIDAIAALLARFELSPRLQPVLTLLYGAHLCGELGVAPVDVARLIERTSGAGADHGSNQPWDEALGRGELAQWGVTRHAGSRVALAPALLRILDQLPPLTGAIIGAPGAVALLGPCIAVAGDEPLAAVAERCRAQVGGAILVAYPGADRGELLLEARALGAAALLRLPADEPPPNVAAILVVDDAALAELLGLPRVG